MIVTIEKNIPMPIRSKYAETLVKMSVGDSILITDRRIHTVHYIRNIGMKAIPKSRWTSAKVSDDSFRIWRAK